MQDKFDYYDLLGSIIPGLVLLGGMYLLFYWFGIELKIPAFSEAVTTIVILGIAIFTGNLLQALGSLLEPLYFKTWGGKPSNKLLNGQSRRLSAAYIDYLKTIVQKQLQKDNAEQSEYKLKNSDLFMHCLTLCNQKSLGRVNRFNSLYAYHRSLTSLSLCFLVITVIALIRVSVLPGAVAIVLAEIAITLILWNRTRERGIYFAEEVLRVGSCEIVSPIPKKDDK